MANIAFLMYHLKMSPELIDIIEGLFTKDTSGMEEYKITILTKLATFDMFLILCL